MKTVEVAAALIQDASGRYLIARRREGTHLAGFWEFPGGKREADETLEQCLKRELSEELGADFVLYQTISQMEDAVRAAGNKDLEFCKACFEGVYPTGDITERMLADIEQDRLAASNS